MDAAGLRALQFQLDQVNSKLNLDPNNALLKAMAVKLESLIKLSQEEPKEQIDPAPVTAPKKSVEQPKTEEPIYRPENISAEKYTDAKRPTSVPATVSESTFSSTHKAPTSVASPSSQKVETKSGSGPVRRKHTRAEHAQKKEAEHAVKQQSWQSFQQKTGGKAPLGSRFPGKSTGVSSSVGYKPSPGSLNPYSSNVKPK